MKNNYSFSNRTHSPIQNKNSVNWRLCLTMLFSFFFILVGYAQKGKNDVILHTCIQDIGNGLFRAEFGYTNPTNKTITVGEDESVVFLSDKDDDESNGIQKIVGITTFEPGTHDNVLGEVVVVFNSSGHAKWTVTFGGNNETKIRANAASPVCEEPCVVCPVYGGIGKISDPIGSELTALGTNAAGDIPSELIFQLNTEGEVLIEIVPTNGNMQAVLNLLQLAAPAGFGRSVSDFIVDPVIIAAKYATIDVYFPITRLLELNAYGDGTIDTIVNFARPLFLPNSNVGTVDSQGDAAMKTDIVRESFTAGREEDGTRIPIDGRGIKIGVISDSYDRVNPGVEAALDVDQSDLPGALNDLGYTTEVDVIKDFPGNGSDEGRAMMQIIHDVAPGAEVGFYTGVLSPRDLALGIELMSMDDYMIINDDVTYPMEPFFGDGEIAEAIQEFTAKPGRVYVTSAGNFADNAQQGVFVNSSTSVVPDFLPAGTVAHVFGTNPDGSQDIGNKISLEPGTYMFVLQWDDPQASQNNSDFTSTDLDIYLITQENNLVVDTNRDNEFGDSVEAMLFQASASSTVNIMITSANGPAPANLAFRYIAFRSNGLEYLEYTDGAPTVSGHAMTKPAVTVGAVFHELAQNPSPETFSSYAGTLANNVTLEVDISAPDGVDINNITNFGTDTDGTGFNNFFGTSAAAPHAAATFALMLSAIPTWYPGGFPQDLIDDLGLVVENNSNVLGDQALALLKSAAVPSGIPEQAGIGLINATAALQRIATQTAVLDSLEVPEGKKDSLSIRPVQVTLIGKYFPEAPEVLMVVQDSIIELEIISSTDTEIVVTVPPFLGDPYALVNTLSVTESGDDGGNSNPLTIIDDGRIPIKIYADTVDIKYGQDYVFDFTVVGLPEGIEIGDELPPIKFTSPADARAPFPSVTNYEIVPSFDMENASPAQIAAALDGYLVGFVKGLLRVTKKDLEITPEPLEVTYGDAILLELNYTYDSTGITDNELFRKKIDSAHTADFFVDNKLALINRFKAVVNTEIFELLDGGSWMATENTINNRFKAVVNGMDLIDLDVELFEDYITNRFKAVVNAELNRFKAVVNGEDLLSGNVTFNNRFKAVVNDSGLGDDENDYNSVFTIIDLLDDSEDGGAVSKFYSLNLVTGLDVTTSSEDVQYSYSGAFLSSIAANFNISYVPGSFIVLPKALTASTSNLIIPYGTELTKDDLITTFDGWAFEGEFQESVATVFPEDDGGIPYYFLKLNEDGTPLPDIDENRLELDALKELGDYLIKIGNPQNYTITNTVDETFGTLTIEAAPLPFNPVALSVKYGETPEIDPGFGPFTYEDNEGVLLVDGQIPYYFKKVGGDDTVYTIGGPVKMDVDEYDIFITDDPDDNYTIVPDAERGKLKVEPAVLTVKTNPLDIPYGVKVSDVIETTITGFAYNDDEITGNDEDLSTVFPDGNGGSLIPYLFVKGTDDPLGIDAVKELGTYVIEVTAPSSGNYVIAYDPDHSTLTISKAPLTFTPLAITISYGELPVIEPNFEGFAPTEDEAILYVEGQLPYYFTKDGDTFTLAQLSNMNVGVYQIFITDDPNDNYVFTPDANLGTLTIAPAILTFTPLAITVTYGVTPVIDPNFGGFAPGETEVVLNVDGKLPYYFVDSFGNEYGRDTKLNTGNYGVFIADDPYDNYKFGEVPGNVGIGTLSVNKAILDATIQDLVVDEGVTIDPNMIMTNIIGYAYNEGEQDVFQGGLQFSIEDVEGNPYTGAGGVYFIKIVEPEIFNYTLRYNRIGTVYVNSNDVNRKIRTYTDCVEENPGDPDGLYYIAHFRYENPNDEAIYILEGPENQLTGPAALTSIGELPIKFLPGEHTFEFRFDGNTIKWELISLNSNHKTSTITNVNADSNKCDSSNTTNESGIPIYKLYPNPVKKDSTCSDCEDDILYIEQDISAMVTLDVFDLTGMLIESLSNTTLDGTIAPPTTHEINMSGLEAGIYFIRLSTNNDVQVFSVVKD